MLPLVWRLWYKWSGSDDEKDMDDAHGGFSVPLFISNVESANVNQFSVLFSGCVVIGWRGCFFSWTKQDVES